MTRNRAAFAIPAAVLALSGCGVAAAVTAHTKTVSMVIPKPSVSDGQRLHSLPRPAVLPVVKATPPASNPGRPTAPGSSAFLVANMSGAGADSWLEILTRTGAVVAKTAINPTQGWMVAAGPGGAYWTQSGSEYVLSSTGAVHRLGAVPADATGVLISPDGTEYAYATADTSTSGVTTNKIVVVRVGRSAVTIADRLSDPNHPTADAPSLRLGLLPHQLDVRGHRVRPGAHRRLRLRPRSTCRCSRRTRQPSIPSPRWSRHWAPISRAR